MKGLEWTWNMDYRKVEVQIDSIEALKWIMGDQILMEPLYGIILKYKRWLSKEWEIVVWHVYREQNEVVNKLAHMAYLQGSN